MRAGYADARARIEKAAAPAPARTTAKPGRRRDGRGRPEKGVETSSHIGGVMLAQGLVRNRAGQFAQAPFEAGASFRRLESLALGFTQEQHFRERLGAAQNLSDRLGPARAREVVGILALGQQRETQA